ncbi:Clp protease [Clostridiaceae bacterium 14S0207]|nr:Clp protease [Clostridiaceae bacterium 14S0207]
MRNLYNSQEDFIKNDVNEENNEVNSEEDQTENIKEMGVPQIEKKIDDRIQVVPIIGQIEGHMAQNPQTKTTKYEHIIPMLIAMERDDNVRGILTVLNTVGGDVEAGLAIAEMIRSLSKPTVSLVIGGGHSIGVPLATASTYSFISPSATMIIHPIRMNGLVIGVPQTFHYFDKMQERISDFIVRTSHIEKHILNKLMLETKDLLNDMGTILIGKQAVECGLIDEVGGVKEALKKLNELIDENK